jgi:hypothetical protein
VSREDEGVLREVINRALDDVRHRFGSGSRDLQDVQIRFVDEDGSVSTWKTEDPEEIPVVERSDDASSGTEQLIEDYLDTLDVADATMHSREFAVRDFLEWVEEADRDV